VEETTSSSEDLVTEPFIATTILTVMNMTSSVALTTTEDKIFTLPETESK